MEAETCNSEKEQLAVLWTPSSKIIADFRRTLRSPSNVKARVVRLRKAILKVSDLSYTGSEFEKVFLVLGKNIDLDSESWLILLYNTIIRSNRNFTSSARRYIINKLNRF